MNRRTRYNLQEQIKQVLAEASREEAMDFYYYLADWATLQYESLLFEPNSDIQDYDNED